MIIRRPDRAYRLKDALPAIDLPTTPIPKSWGAVPGLTAWSIKALSLPLGTVIQDVVGGRPVVAQIQTHYKFGAHPEWAPRAHKGTSVFALATLGQDGRLVALQDPPDNFAQGADAFSGEALGLPTLKGHLVEAHGRLPVWLIPVATTTVGALAGGPVVAALGLLAGFSTYRWLAR